MNWNICKKEKKNSYEDRKQNKSRKQPKTKKEQIQKWKYKINDRQCNAM